MKKFFVIASVFIFAFAFRVWDLKNMGRTWDEGAYVRQGVEFVELFKKRDFGNKFWYDNFDHPPLARYLFGIAGDSDIVSYENNLPELTYGYFKPRLISVFLSSITVALITLFTWEYISPFAGISSGIILSLLPFFLGFSQLATLESPIMFIFTASVYSFIKFLEKSFSKKWIIICGVLSGLALLVKQSNALLFPLFGIFYVIWRFPSLEKNYKKLLHKKLVSLIIIPVIASLTFIILWPMPFLHLKEVIAFHNAMWVRNTNLSPPEVFFGRLMLVPKIYYVVMFFITTPGVVLILFFIGVLRIDKKRTWIELCVLAWFAFPFIQSLYPFKQHGVRYVIEIYAPLAIISGIGLEYLCDKLHFGKLGKFGLFGILITYLLIVAIKQSPYYIDYFNEVVGGSSGVYKTKMFQLGWWGEGTAEAVYYVSKIAKPAQRVGVIFNQVSVAPLPKNIRVETYDKRKVFDYVILNYFSVLREGFDAAEIYRDYKKIHSVFTNGAPIVDVYKRK